MISKLNLILSLIIVFCFGIIIYLIKKKWSLLGGPDRERANEETKEFLMFKENKIFSRGKSFFKKSKDKIFSFGNSIFNRLGNEKTRAIFKKAHVLKSKIKLNKIKARRSFLRKIRLPKVGFLNKLKRVEYRKFFNKTKRGASLVLNKAGARLKSFFLKTKEGVKDRIAKMRPSKELSDWQKEKTREIFESDEYLHELLKHQEEEEKPKEAEDIKLEIEEKGEDLKTIPTQEKIAPAPIPKTKPRPMIFPESFKRVEEKWIRAIAEDAKNIEAYKKLGCLYYHQNDFGKAKECFSAALKLGSEDFKIKKLFQKCKIKLIVKDRNRNLPR